MPAATLETLEQRINVMEQEIARLKQASGQERKGEDTPKKSVRDRLLEYMAEGPHLSPETAEQLRKDIREAREEHLG